MHYFQTVPSIRYMIPSRHLGDFRKCAKARGIPFIDVRVSDNGDGWAIIAEPSHHKVDFRMIVGKYKGKRHTL